MYDNKYSDLNKYIDNQFCMFFFGKNQIQIKGFGIGWPKIQSNEATVSRRIQLNFHLFTVNKMKNSAILLIIWLLGFAEKQKKCFFSQLFQKMK